MWLLAHNKAVKSLASLLGRSALRGCSRMASRLLRDQSLRAERRLPGRWKLGNVEARRHVDYYVIHRSVLVGKPLWA